MIASLPIIGGNMKYTAEVELNLPREKVIELFDNTENLKKWQEGLVSFEHIEGEPGKEGAKSQLKYKMGKREIEMVETITKRNLPDEFFGTYETKGVWNEVRNYFIVEGDQKTKWRLDTEFKGSGFMKIMMLFAPGMFKKQTLKSMNDFKEFAENIN
jgi:hypothetical protein